MSEQRGGATPMPATERRDPAAELWLDALFDWGLGLSAVGWAIRALVAGEVHHLVGGTIAAINLTAGLLFIARRRPRARAAVREDALCVGSVVMSGVALELAPAYPQWPPPAAWLFVAGGLMALSSLWVLGRSFGVFPAFRGLVSRGPFALIRHPIYLAELIMVAACSLAASSLLGLAPLALAIGLVVIRIAVEERLLRQQPAYGDYAARVRWRLLPGLW